MTGDADATERWLSEIAHGGDYDQTNEKGELQSMPDFWNYAPSGGEFTSAVPMKNLLEMELSTDDKSYSKGTFYIPWSE